MKLLVAIASLTLMHVAFAEDFVVAPGEEWPHTTQDLKPGDRVYLAPGAHLAQTLMSVVGTKEAPIQLLSADPSQPATIIGGDVSLSLLGCSHVSIGPVLLAAGEMGGITIVGSPENPSVGISIRGAVLARPGFHSGHGSGISATNVRDLTIDRVRIESWGDASLIFNHAENVLVLGTASVAANESKRGIVMTGNSKNLRVERSIIEALKGPGIWINDAQHVSITGCVFAKCTHPLELGTCGDVSISYSTIYEPHDCPLSFFGAADAVTLDSNLISWKPGAIKALFCHADRATNLSCGANLWWSEEMPEAMAVLGPFPGETTRPQLFNADPALHPRALTPQTPEAQAFGHTAFRARTAEIAPKSERDNTKGP